MERYENICKMIAEQQKGKEGTPAWMVGEQLKEIASREPVSAELLEKDLAVTEMNLEKAADQIKKKADELHKAQKGNCVCVPPNVAEEVLRKFYGLPKKGETVDQPAATEVLDLGDFL